MQIKKIYLEKMIKHEKQIYLMLIEIFLLILLCSMLHTCNCNTTLFSNEIIK